MRMLSSVMRGSVCWSILFYFECDVLHKFESVIFLSELNREKEAFLSTSLQRPRILTTLPEPLNTSRIGD